MKQLKTGRLLSILTIVTLLLGAGFIVDRRFATCHLKNPIGTPPTEIGYPFTFAVIGDSHSFSASLKSAINFAVSKKNQFAIHTGDFVDYDDPIEYRWFLSKVRPRLNGMPLYLVKGNHETMAPEGGFSSNFDRWIPESNVAFSVGCTEFLILDSSDGTIGKKGLAFLNSRINRPGRSTTRTLVFTHIPPSYGAIKGCLPPHESTILISALKDGSIDWCSVNVKLSG